MKEDKLNEVLINVITSAKDATGKAIDLASEGITKAVDIAQVQIPDIIHQLMLWHFVNSAIQNLIGLSIMGFIFYINYKIYKWFVTTKESIGNHPEIVFLLFECVPIAFIWISLLNLEWLKIWLAPKIWLIEYVARLMK